MLSLPRPHVRVLRGRSAAGALFAFTAAAVVLRHLALVLYQAFFHFGAPERYILASLEMPFLQRLYDAALVCFVPVASSSAVVLAALFIFSAPRGGWIAAGARTLAVASAGLQVWFSIDCDAPLTLSLVREFLAADRLLLAAAVLALAGKLRDLARITFPPRPVWPVLLALAAAAAVFYGLRETAVDPWWTGFELRAAAFVAVILAVAVVRGLLLEPLIGSESVRPALKLLALWLLAGLFPAYHAARMLSVHAGRIYPFLVGTDVPLDLFFDAFGFWLGCTLVAWEAALLLAFRGRPVAFECAFPAGEVRALAPVRLVERLARGRLRGAWGFALAWLLAWGVPAGVVLVVFKGGFLFFLLGPAVPFCLTLLACAFVTQIAHFALPAERGRGTLPSVIAAVLAAGAVYVVPRAADPAAWGDAFRDRGSLERFVACALAPLAPPPDPRYRAYIASLPRFEHAYEVEPLPGGPRKDWNLVLFTSDALRAENLGCYGYKRPTSPEIDRFARRALRFARAYTPASHTFTSIRSLLRGDLTDRPPESLDGTWLKGFFACGVFERGLVYNTDMLHLPPESGVEGLAFVRRFELDERTRFEKDLDELARGSFFLWVHNTGTHMRYYLRPDSPNFGAGLLDLYDNNVHHFDRFAGWALRLLESRGLLERTVVVITSDHGEHFNEHGVWGHTCPTFYEEVIRIPLLISVPGGRRGVDDALVTLSDLGPTFMDLFRVRARSVPGWIRSLAGCLIAPQEGGVAAPPRWDGGGLRLIPLTSIYHHSAGILREDGIKYFVTPEAEYLFDLRSDPGEFRNLARTDPARTAAARALFERFFNTYGRRR